MNKIYDLTPFKGKDLLSIKAFDSNDCEVSIPDDEYIQVDENGRLYCSSYNLGILSWSEKDNSYIEYFRMGREKIEISYFSDMEIEED